MLYRVHEFNTYVKLKDNKDVNVAQKLVHKELFLSRDKTIVLTGFIQSQKTQGFCVADFATLV